MNVFYEKLNEEDIIEKLNGLSGWSNDNGKIFKRFEFNSYNETIDFVNMLLFESSD